MVYERNRVTQTPAQQIWLIRHGETAWSRTGQHTGRKDLPLLPESEPALRRLRPLLASHTFALRLTSPLQRARRTAEVVGLTPIEIEPDLQEWDYGAYEGKTIEEIRAEVPGWTIWEDGVKGGETIEEVAARAERVLTRVRQANGDAVLVAHGHLLRILAACWLRLDPRAARLFALSTATYSILGYEHGSPVLFRWNDQP
jgi:broad specificity phosphatase PhoE